MARSASRSFARAAGVFVAIFVVLAILRPWTVRPLQTAQTETFDAKAYAAQAWPRIVDEASRTALDVPAARQLTTHLVSPGAPGRKSVFVKFTGTVTPIDRRSRVGLARVRVDDGPQGEVAVQVGPVIRGTAIRDAATFIRFNDFSNQFEFAAVSNALHERVLRDVVGSLNVDGLVGKRVNVLAAATLQVGMPAGAVLEVIPIQIRLDAERR